MRKSIVLAAVLLASPASAWEKPRACKAAYAATDLFTAAVGLAKAICKEDLAGDECTRAIAASKFAERGPERELKKCQIALNRAARNNKTAAPQWSYDPPPPWRPEP